jgi:hypothetical protein
MTCLLRVLLLGRLYLPKRRNCLPKRKSMMQSRSPRKSRSWMCWSMLNATYTSEFLLVTCWGLGFIFIIYMLAPSFAMEFNPLLCYIMSCYCNRFWTFGTPKYPIWLQFMVAAGHKYYCFYGYLESA